jgi:hypothetical protein
MLAPQVFVLLSDLFERRASAWDALLSVDHSV